MTVLRCSDASRALLLSDAALAPLLSDAVHHSAAVLSPLSSDAALPPLSSDAARTPLSSDAALTPLSSDAAPPPLSSNAALAPLLSDAARTHFRPSTSGTNWALLLQTMAEPHRSGSVRLRPQSFPSTFQRISAVVLQVYVQFLPNTFGSLSAAGTAKFQRTPFPGVLREEHFFVLTLASAPPDVKNALLVPIPLRHLSVLFQFDHANELVPNVPSTAGYSLRRASHTRSTSATVA